MKGIIISILFLIITIITVACLSINVKTNSKNYSINHYIDTINGHIILSTVCNYSDNISISTLELNNNDTINISKNKY